MENKSKKVWFEGSNEISCNLEKVKNSLTNLGEHFVGLVSLMPGMIKVDLIEQGKDFVSIQTNEGIMKRFNIIIHSEAGNIALEFDEEYQAGKILTTQTHFRHEFAENENKVIHKIVISNLKAPGFAGFFYRKFGSSKMGKAFLETYKNFLEK